jgi:hypothetical protein
MSVKIKSNIKSAALYSVLVFAAAALVASCGGGKTGGGTAADGTPAGKVTEPQDGGKTAAGGNPSGKVVDATPCAVFDDDEWFAATGIASGPSNRMGDLQQKAIMNGQKIIRLKMGHESQGIVKDDGTSEGRHISDGIILKTLITCGPMFSAPNERGLVTCYVGVKARKKSVAEKLISTEIDERVTGDTAEIRRKTEEELKK